MRLTRRRAALAAATVGAARAHGGPGLLARAAALPALVRDTLLGRYDGTGRGTLVLWALGLAYLVSPIDLLPEALLTLPGLADDALVAGALLTSVLGATSAYADWRAGVPGARGPVIVPGEVVPAGTD